jgi:hypothetical protein
MVDDPRVERHVNPDNGFRQIAAASQITHRPKGPSGPKPTSDDHIGFWK